MIQVYNVAFDNDAAGASYSSILVAGFLIAAGLLSLGGWALWRVRTKPRPPVTADSSPVMLTVVCLVVGACEIGYVVHRQAVLSDMRKTYALRAYDVVGGCVGSFSESVDVHHIATDTFLVDGQSFTVTGGPWPIGYRATAYDGSPVRPGANVELLVSHGRILRVSVVSQNCDHPRQQPS